MRLSNLRAAGAALALALPFGAGLTTAAAEEAYDCQSPQARQTSTTIELVLAKQWKGREQEIRQTLAAPNVKLRVKFFPFLDPPANIGIGKCVSAEQARRAIQAASAYNRGVDRLILQEIMPHHWIKIGSTDTAELAWNPVSAEGLARLADPALTTEQFQELYRRLATPTERKLPFGMGTRPRAQAPRDASAVQIVEHEWRPDTVWERIGKTKFIWSATVRNDSAERQRVFVYYDLLDERGVPLARNVANRFLDAGQTATITSDSYILSVDLPRVTGSRAAVKVGFPN
ncbi:MAG: hypothetical protein AB1515_11030 [Nitrospirota bacterium]